jgi:hypothetical protein
MQQNGEVGSHADEPAFYSAPIPNAQLATITLLPYDYDDNVNDDDNNNNNLDAGDRVVGVRVHIAALPRSGGSLYLYVFCPGSSFLPFLVCLSLSLDLLLPACILCHHMTRV